MERDVEFRLTVVRDPAAKREVAQWEKDLLKADTEYHRAKKRNNDKTHQDENRRRGLKVQAEIRARAAETTAARAALATRLAAHKAAKAKELAITKAAEASALATARASHAYRMGMYAKEAIARGLVAGGGAGGGGGSGGGKPGLMGRAANFAMSGKGLVAGLGLGVAAGAIGNASNKFAEYNQEKLKLEGLTGSARKAADAMRELQEVSAASGTSFNVLTQGMNTMVGFGVSADVAKDKMKELALIAAGDSQKVGRLALAFAQASGQGRLMGEELNQMIDAGFNPLLEISKNTGKSIVELRQEMMKGQISIDMVSKAFTSATAEGSRYADIADKLGATSAASAAVAAAAWDKLNVSIGRAIESTIGGTKRAIQGGAANNLSGAADVLDFMFGEGNDKQAAYENYVKRFAQNTTRSSEGLSANPEIKLGRAAIELDRKSLSIRTRLRAIDQEREQAAADKLAAERAEQNLLSKRIVDEREINKIRADGAAKELQARQKAFDLAVKTTQEARAAYQSARERFGGMSAEDQAATVATVARARKDVRGLTQEDIGRLNSLGTIESKELASKALQYRSTTMFGTQQSRERFGALEQAKAQIEKRRKAILNAGTTDYNVDPWEEGYAYDTGRKKYSRRQQQELRQLELRETAINRVQSTTANRISSTAAARESLFNGERGQLRQAMQSQTQVNANVKQTIEFVAKFDQSASQIANEVMRLNAIAINSKNDEIIKRLAPIISDLEQIKKRQRANMPGRGV